LKGSGKERQVKKSIPRARNISPSWSLFSIFFGLTLAVAYDLGLRWSGGKRVAKREGQPAFVNRQTHVFLINAGYNGKLMLRKRGRE
jgi:hypothetical protein